MYPRMHLNTGYWQAIECNTNRVIKIFGHGKEGEKAAKEFIANARLFVCKYDNHLTWAECEGGYLK